MLDVKRFIDGLHEYLGRVLQPIAQRIKALEERVPETGPQGEKGEKGDRGEKGEPGQQGEPGRDGRDGLPGVQGERGMDGKDGRDGVDGKDGEHGKDGADGLGFDDLDVEYDGERSFTIKFIRGDKIKQVTLRIPVLLDRGVHREATEYERGDGVTYSGSFWIAQKDAPDGKPGASKDWRLAVKSGRDGKDGKQGPQGQEGKKGKDGRDLTQLGPDGSKW